MKTRFSLVAALVLAFLALGATHGRAESGLEKLEFVTATGTHAYAVEVMRTREEMARGLMFRRYLPDDRGMLFAFGVVEPVAMWMKNTYIPLDMVFIDRKGVVVSIAQDAEPLSERTIPSGGPVWAVVELNAGAAAAIGLAPGDKVRHPIFDR